MEAEQAVKAARRFGRFEPPSFPVEGEVSYGRAEVERLLPHRDPFRFVDGISHVAPEERRIRGFCDVPEDAPVFAGHFPGEPVFPGVLQVEAIGQLGLCLASFVERNMVAIPEDVSPVSVRATRIHHATFLNPVEPGGRMELYAELIEHDEFLGVVAGQLRCGNTVCSTAVMEVYFV